MDDAYVRLCVTLNLTNAQISTRRSLDVGPMFYSNGLGPPLPGSATPRVRQSQDLLLPGFRHSQGPPFLGSATPRVSHYIRYPCISSIQLLFQQIIIFLVNSNFYLHYDFSPISLPLTLW